MNEKHKKILELLQQVLPDNSSFMEYMQLLQVTCAVNRYIRMTDEDLLYILEDIKSANKLLQDNMQ